MSNEETEMTSAFLGVQGFSANEWQRQQMRQVCGPKWIGFLA